MHQNKYNENLHEPIGSKDDYVFKLCVIGDGGVGKTTLIHKYILGSFINPLMTIGTSISNKTVMLDNVVITLQIWDCAGEEQFRRFVPYYIQGVDAGLLMYDIIRYNSVKHLEEWLTFLRFEEKRVNKTIPIVIVGGKIDLEEKRAFSVETVQALLDANHLDYHLTCSSKTGENVNEVFKFILKLLLKEKRT